MVALTFLVPHAGVCINRIFTNELLIITQNIEFFYTIILRRSCLGLLVALARGAEAARRYLLFLDPDVRLLPALVVDALRVRRLGRLLRFRLR